MPDQPPSVQSRGRPSRLKEGADSGAAVVRGEAPARKPPAERTDGRTYYVAQLEPDRMPSLEVEECGWRGEDGMRGCE